MLDYFVLPYDLILPLYPIPLKYINWIAPARFKDRTRFGDLVGVGECISLKKYMNVLSN